MSDRRDSLGELPKQGGTAMATMDEAEQALLDRIQELASKVQSRGVSSWRRRGPG